MHRLLLSIRRVISPIRLLLPFLPPLEMHQPSSTGSPANPSHKIGSSSGSLRQYRAAPAPMSWSLSVVYFPVPSFSVPLHLHIAMGSGCAAGDILRRQVPFGVPRSLRSLGWCLDRCCHFWNCAFFLVDWPLLGRCYGDALHRHGSHLCLGDWPFSRDGCRHLLVSVDRWNMAYRFPPICLLDRLLPLIFRG